MDAYRQDGFTLIEVIASLVLLGILAAGLAVGLPAFVRGYLNMVNAASASLDVEMAVYRILAELQEVTSIDSESGNSIAYTALFPGGGENSTLAYTSGTKTLNLTTDGTTATLLKDVSAFSVTLRKMTAGSIAAGGLADATLIQIDMTVAPPGVASKSYTLRVAPAGLQ